MAQVNINDVLDLFREAEVDGDLDALDSNAPLLQQGMDSLDMMNVFFQIEEKYGVHVEEDSIASGDWDSLTKIANSITTLGA